MLRRLLLAFALLLSAAPASAWWEYGHETVASIAAAHVRPGTLAEMERLLARSASLDTPSCAAGTVQEASVWPDCIKQLKDRFSFASSWHYQNVDICRPFDLEAACKDGNCVSAQIERNARLLADRNLPDRERLMALAFLVHFVGDLHQPLHAGDNGDLGGNRFPVSYGIIAGRTNLHLAWDGYVAERAFSTPPGGPEGLVAALSGADKERLAQGSAEDWSRESWEMSRALAYGTTREDPCVKDEAVRPVIGEKTLETLIPKVRLQAAKGGLRLARLLDEALD